jgi:quercetin dioxygenase-like cupin family protein
VTAAGRIPACLAKLLIAVAVGVLVAPSLPSSAAAQAPAAHRTTLQDQPFPPPKYHTVTIRMVVDPKGGVPPHTHPGVEMAYVLAGQAVLIVQGGPPRSLTAGDSFAMPMGTVHSLRNGGPEPLAVLSTYVVDKSKPLVIPAP